MPQSHYATPRHQQLSSALAAGPAAEAAGVASALAAEAGTVNSSSLLQGRKSVQIEHNGALYQLRATKLGKLILTK